MTELFQNPLDRWTSIDDKLERLIGRIEVLIRAVRGIEVSPDITVSSISDPVAVASLNKSTVQDTLEALTVQRFGIFQMYQGNATNIAGGSNGSITFSIPTNQYLLVRYIAFNGVVNIWTLQAQGIDHFSRQNIIITTDLMNTLIPVQPFAIARSDSSFTVTNGDGVLRTLYINLIGTLLTTEELKKYNQMVNKLFLKR
jgi:hypothetical protein